MVSEIIETIKSSAILVSELLSVRDSGYAGSSNSSGDLQLKVDLRADELLFNAISRIKSVKAVASEERDSACVVNENGEYLISYDPLDGSSLIDSNLSVGSIFGIYKPDFGGKSIVAAAYVVYGPRLEIVLFDKSSSDKGAMHYVYNRSTGWDFIQVIRLNDRGNISSTGGFQKYWSDEHRSLVDSFFNDGYRLRYSGGMVPDLHHILCKGGGIFSYPPTEQAPNGKLRKLFEVYPLALIFEASGGFAIDGKGRLLDSCLSGLHDTTPCFFGSRFEVDRVVEFNSKG